MKRIILLAAGAGIAWSLATQAADEKTNQRLQGSYRWEQNGWIYVHLEGSPAELGFQHGYLLAPEIADTFKVVSAGMVHDSKKDWAFFRTAAQTRSSTSNTMASATRQRFPDFRRTGT